MKQIKIFKEQILELTDYNSEKYLNLYIKFVELFRDFFKKQSLKYINSLNNYVELKKIDDEEKIKQEIENLLKQIYLLWLIESSKEIDFDLFRYWYTPESMIINNEKAVNYAKNNSWFFSWVNETTAKEIWEIISDWIKKGDSIQTISIAIQSKFTNYSLYRASLIAQNEVSKAYSSAVREQHDYYTEKIWIIGWKRAVTQKDSKVRPSHKINENEWWIPKNQPYSWTWDMQAPYWIFCRCHDEYSLVNPDTWLLFWEDEARDNWWGYTDEQIDNFNYWFVSEKPLSIKQREIQAKNWYTNEEIKVVQSYTWNAYRFFTEWFKKWWIKSEETPFFSWIKFLFWFLNKTPNTSWTFYRWHRCKKEEFEFLKSLNPWDIYETKTFFSASLDKKTTKDFFSEKKVRFTIKTKKAKNIMDFSITPAEEEFLFLPKTLFKVEKVEEKNNILEILVSDLNE